MDIDKVLEANPRLKAQRGLVDEAVRLDGLLRNRPAALVAILWQYEGALASPAAQRLSDFDREARRVTGHFALERRLDSRPLPTGQAGFEVKQASAGSLELLLVPVALTAQVLLSDPVQFILTVRSLTGDAKRLVHWLDQRGMPGLRVPDMSALSERLGELRSVRSPGEDAPTAFSIDTRGLKIKARGATRVTIVRRDTDGAVDLIDIES